MTDATDGCAEAPDWTAGFIEGLLEERYKTRYEELIDRVSALEEIDAARKIFDAAREGTPSLDEVVADFKAGEDKEESK